jgi:hypothetical protein
MKTNREMSWAEKVERWREGRKMRERLKKEMGTSSSGKLVN